MNALPAHDLEGKAAADRRRLHSSLEELRVRLHETLNVKRNVREHLGAACGFAALVTFVVGYAVTGIFIER